MTWLEWIRTTDISFAECSPNWATSQLEILKNVIRYNNLDFISLFSGKTFHHVYLLADLNSNHATWTIILAQPNSVADVYTIRNDNKICSLINRLSCRIAVSSDFQERCMYTDYYSSPYLSHLHTISFSQDYLVGWFVFAIRNELKKDT